MPLRDRYLSGRLFRGTGAIVDACYEAWNRLIAEPRCIQSLTDFEWGSTGQSIISLV